MAESVVASLRNKLALDPSRLMPGHAPAGTISASSSLLSLTSAAPEVDLSNPEELRRLLKAAHELQEQVAALTQAQSELQSTNKSLRAEIETYSRHTLPNAVMTKYERDSSVSGIEELGGLHKVPHRRSASGSWRRVEEEKLDANQIVEAQRLQEQGTDKLFRAGWMYKEGGLVHNWKRRLFILYANSICYYVNPEDSTPKGVIKLDTCTISPVKSRDGVDKPCMELVFSKTGRRWRFFCEKVSDNRRWFSAINNRIVTLSYIHRCEQVKQRPDYRVLQFLNTVPANADAAAKILPDSKSPKSSIIGPIEQWPDSHPLVLSNQSLSLDTVSVVARIIGEPSTCPGGGVSQLEVAHAGLGFFELETIFKAMSSSEYNIVVQKERSSSMDRRVDASEDLAPDYTPSEHHAIQSLNVSGNSFADPRDENNLAAAHALAKVLQVNTTLTELVLDNCGINDRILEVIAEALPTALSPIRKLSLKGNTFTDRGLSLLADQLAKGILPLSSRSKDGGANNLQSPLRVLPLVELALDNNQIADAGAAAVAKLILTPKIAVTRLTLCRNKIGAEGAVALAEAVSTNATLTSFDLSENAVKKEHSKAAAALSHMAQTNESLVDVRFLDFALTPPTLNSMRLVARFKVGLSQQ